MDPLLMSILVAWFLCRGTVEDTAHNLRGKRSPRQEYRAKHGPSAAAKIGHAVADRAATRIVNGPSEKPPKKAKPKGSSRFGRWARSLWEDSCTSARESVNDFYAWREGRNAAKEGRADPNGEVPNSPPGVGEHNPGDSGTRRRWWQWHRPEPPFEPEEPEPVQATAEVLRDDPAADPGDTAHAADTDNEDGEQHHLGLPAATDDTPEQGSARSTPTQEVIPTPTPLSTPTAAIGNQPSQGGHDSMSTPTAAETGLGATVTYTENMATVASEAVTSLETTAASLESANYGSEATAPLHQAMEHFQAAQAALDQAQAALQQSMTVRESYEAAPHTGNRDHVMAD